MAIEDRVKRIRAENLARENADISAKSVPRSSLVETSVGDTALTQPPRLDHPRFLASRDIVKEFSVGRTLATVAAKYWGCGRLVGIEHGFRGGELSLQFESHTSRRNPDYKPGQYVSPYPEKGSMIPGGYWLGEVGPTYLHSVYKYPDNTSITVKTEYENKQSSQSEDPNSSSTGFPLDLYLVADIKIGNPLPLYNKQAVFRGPHETDKFEEFFAQYIVDQGLDVTTIAEVARARVLTIPKDFQLGYPYTFFLKHGRMDEAIRSVIGNARLPYR